MQNGYFTDAGLALLVLGIMGALLLLIACGGPITYPLYKLTGGRKSFRAWCRWYSENV